MWRDFLQEKPDPGDLSKMSTQPLCYVQLGKDQVFSGRTPYLGERRQEAVSSSAGRSFTGVFANAHMQPGSVEKKGDFASMPSAYGLRPAFTLGSQLDHKSRLHAVSGGRSSV